MRWTQRMHLIAIRRDSTGFQHVHPVMDDEGTWTLGLDLTPGQWRLFTDFAVPESPGLTLGADLAVPGQYDPAALPQPSRVAEVPGGYTVSPPGRHEHRAVTTDTRWRHDRFTSGGDRRGCLTPRRSVRQPLLPATYRRGPTRPPRTRPPREGASTGPAHPHNANGDISMLTILFLSLLLLHLAALGRSTIPPAERLPWRTWTMRDLSANTLRGVQFMLNIRTPLQHALDAYDQEFTRSRVTRQSRTSQKPGMCADRPADGDRP